MVPLPHSSQMRTLRRGEKEPEQVQIFTRPPTCARKQGIREGARRLHPGRGKTPVRPDLSLLLSAVLTSFQMSGKRVGVSGCPALSNVFS